ncbi:MAG: SDR family NAD(P)-dependent oxidoreductase, partial [Alphaproteobacteria bacterium]|nr:SDR family NAD(P)-dependent oxidoreductase [Alphaproteobacteria bacterium]
MLERVKDKIAVVTGAGQGIGAAICRRLAHEGAKLVLVDINPECLQDIAAELSAAGTEVLAVAADISKKDQVVSMIEQAKDSFGTVDILVNNAGIIRDGFLAKISEENWDKVLEVNLKGPFLCCQAVFDTMKARNSGKIVNIVSRAWLGNIGQSNYSASKGGLVSLTRTLALELARFQINVNAVAPGLIESPMTRSMPEEARARLLRMQPTGK